MVKLVERELCRVTDVAANDVSAVAHHGELVLAWGHATLEQEVVQVGKLGPDGQLVRLHEEPHAFRPRLCATVRGPVLACCRVGADSMQPAVLQLATGQRWLLDVAGTHAVDLAAEGDGLWLAAALGQEIALLRQSGATLAPVCSVPGTAPALLTHGGRTWLAWVDGGALLLGTLGPDGVRAAGRPAQLDPSDPPGAPALCGAANGTVWLAWHAPLGDATLRWLHLSGSAGDHSPPVPAECRDARGEDQGWEMPAPQAGPDGRLWLVGRSSGGFHLQVLGPHGWSQRFDVSGPGWSNRSRSCALVRWRDALVFVRGTPTGLVLSQLELREEGGAGARAPASRSAPEPATTRRARPASAGAGPRRVAGQQVLFGDIHQHSVFSDGTGEPERAYLRARGHYGHDIFALTDHERLGCRCLGPVSWRHQCELADQFYEPGAFVTLLAYEFTGARMPGPGHKCVYFNESVPEGLPPKSVDALWQVLRQHGAIAVPHHVAWTGADMEHHDPELQPVWEICSVHGAYEVEGEQRIPPRADVVLQGQTIRSALDAGLVFGFVGGTDAHGLRWHHGVSRRADPLRTGLTALFAEPTRQSVLDALRRRQCYATSGARILLHLDLDGAPMGSVVPHHSGQLHVQVAGTRAVQRLSVIQDGREVWAGSGDARMSCTLRLQARGARSYCYVRVQQVDGEDAWSSPLWLQAS